MVDDEDEEEASDDIQTFGEATIAINRSKSGSYHLKCVRTEEEEECESTDDEVYNNDDLE